MKRSMMMLAILTLAVVAGAAHADAVVQARADVQSRVYVDGAYVGVTPVDIVIPRRGDHDVRFRAGHLDQAFVVHAPGHSRAVTPLFARFAVALAPVVVSQPVYVESPVVYYGHHHHHWR